MSSPILSFKIEPMTLADIPSVVALEQTAYAMAWFIRDYEHELQHNHFAHYYVLHTSLPRPINSLPFLEVSPNPSGGQRSRGEASHSVVGGSDESIFSIETTLPIGLSGFWLMANEVHINTIAVHPDWRGLGLGEWLLLALLEEGQTLGATIATLEVRPSNHSALALYHKYRFEQVGRRRRYYSDNDEDALICTTPPLDLPDYQAMLSQQKVALFQRLAKIEGKQ